MKQDLIKVIADGTSVIAVALGGTSSAAKVAENYGWLEFFDTHAAGLGVVCSIIFGIMAVFFNILNNRKFNKAASAKVEAEEAKTLAENNKIAIDKMNAVHNKDNTDIKELLSKINQTIKDK